MYCAMFHAQINTLTCLYVQIYMLYVICHVFQYFVPLFVLGKCQGYMFTCSYDVIGYALLGYMYLCVYFHAIWLDPCFHMLICLDPCSSFSTCQASTCLHACFYAYMSRSMLSHAYVLGSMSSTCFMLSSMCLCAPCHVCVTQSMFVMPCAIVALLSLCLSFLCFGLMVRT